MTQIRARHYFPPTDDEEQRGLLVYIPRADPHDSHRNVDGLHESLIMQGDVVGHKNASTTDDHGLESVDLVSGKWRTRAWEEGRATVLEIVTKQAFGTWSIIPECGTYGSYLCWVR